MSSTFSLAAPASCFTPLDPSPVGPTIKMLDLLTNRYHTGIVRDIADHCLEIQMATTARLRIGQRIRFALADHDASPIIPRSDMRTAVVMRVLPDSDATVLLYLAFSPEMAAA